MFCRLRKHKDAGSKCASCGLRACICCLFCLENFIKFINHNAYTVIAMEGYSFCTSAKIVSEINEMKHIYVTCSVLCYVIYVMFTFSVHLGPKTQNIPSGKVSSDTYFMVLK